MLRTVILAVTYIFEMLVAYVFFIQQGDLKFKKRTGLAIGTGIFFKRAVGLQLISNRSVAERTVFYSNKLFVRLFGV